MLNACTLCLATCIAFSLTDAETEKIRTISSLSLTERGQHRLQRHFKNLIRSIKCWEGIYARDVWEFTDANRALRPYMSLICRAIEELVRDREKSVSVVGCVGSDAATLLTAFPCLTGKKQGKLCVWRAGSHNSPPLTLIYEVFLENSLKTEQGIFIGQQGKFWW